MSPSKSGLPKIGLLGASGRMGKVLQTLLRDAYSDRLSLHAEVGRAGGFDRLLECDVIIDFSLPEAFLAFAKAAGSRAQLPAIVTGTTGWAPEEWAVVQSIATRTPLVYSANFSIGVFFLKEILRFASSNLRRAGYHPVMVETHHIHKLDAPSGTAKALCEAISPGRGESVQTHSIRAGEVVGDHKVTFYGPADEITISHSAKDRTSFARGAIDVALWLTDPSQKPRTAGQPLTLDDYFNERYRKP